MNESRSWLLNSASKISQHRHTAGRFAAGFGIAGLVIAGFAMGPAAANSPIVLAQASTADIQQKIPVPEPANLPPPTAADFDRAAGKSDADRKIEALMPIPEPANVPPLTAGDLKPDATATATVPAVTPAQAATPPADERV